MNRQTSDHIFELNDVSFHYPEGSLGLHQCSIAIKRGSRTVVLGANGTGKTTLFLHLNGILKPQSGMVFFNSAPIDYTRQGLHNLRSRVGLVFQNPDSQLFSASVREDVSFGPMNLRLDNGIVRSRVEEALLAVGMTDCADKPVHNLSYGQKKRVCIAGVLAMCPDVLILDEPMAGLDVVMQEELATILDRLHADGMTIIIATHDMDFAYQAADSISVMVKGECVATWAAKELPDFLNQLVSYGLRVPKVAELHRILAAAGILDGGEPPLRSHQALISSLSRLLPHDKTKR